MAVTVLFSNGQFSLSVVADGGMVRPDDIKYILQGGVDEVTKTVLQAQLTKDNQDNKANSPVEDPLDPAE